MLVIYADGGEVKGLIWVHLICRVGHVGCGTFFRGICVRKLHVEQVENKTIESGAQTITEASDPSNHPLHHTCGAQDVKVSVRTQQRINIHLK